MQTVFALASGRSGTRFLSDVIRHNARGCVSVHEPLLDWSNPSLFGKAIYHHQQGQREPIRRLLERKRARIERYRTPVYVETSHAFLKSYFDLALEYFPETRLVHLVRHPLKVALSEANRERLVHRLRIPFRYYAGEDGRKYFRWSLTGNEPIFQHFERERLSLFQWYLVQWIEIENRAMRFLAAHNLHAACFTLHSPHELNQPERLRALFEFLNLEPRHAAPQVAGFQNRTPGVRTQITEREERECREVLAALPAAALEIFRHEPYSGFEWGRLLIKPS